MTMIDKTVLLAKLNERKDALWTVSNNMEEQNMYWQEKGEMTAALGCYYGGLQIDLRLEEVVEMIKVVEAM